MNVLQDIDSTLHYENIENAWKKYKFVIIGILIAIFATTAGLTFYKQTTQNTAKADSVIVFNTIIENANKENYAEKLTQAITKLQTTTAIETLSLELAKAYKKENNIAGFEQTLTQLTASKTQSVKQISTYMLAEHFLAVDPKVAVEFINDAKIKQTSFTYALLQEVKATALLKTGKTEEAKALFSEIANSNTFDSIKQRAQFKLNQII